MLKGFYTVDFRKFGEVAEETAATGCGSDPRSVQIFMLLLPFGRLCMYGFKQSLKKKNNHCTRLNTTYLIYYLGMFPSRLSLVRTAQIAQCSVACNEFYSGII